MECYNCGYKLAAEAERCPRCGQRFKPREQPTAAGKANPTLLDRVRRLLGLDRSQG